MEKHLQDGQAKRTRPGGDPRSKQRSLLKAVISLAVLMMMASRQLKANGRTPYKLHNKYLDSDRVSVTREDASGVHFRLMSACLAFVVIPAHSL